MNRALGHLWRVIFLSCGVLSLGACQQPAYRWHIDKSADFGKLHTYRWLPAQTHGTATRELSGRSVVDIISDAVDRDLAAKGFVRAEGDAPADFTVQVKSRIDYVQIEQVPVAIEDPNQTWSNRYEVPSPGPTDSTAGPALRTVGTMTITMRNAQDVQIWQGTSERILTQRATDPERIERIETGIAELLARFPPRPGDLAK